MSEYIDKTEMLIRLKCLEPKKDDFKDDDCFQAAESQHDMICEYLKPMQPADVAPVVHGRWSKEMRFTEDFMGNRTYGYKCSVCGRLASRLPFCGNCGAKMDEDESEG